MGINAEYGLLSIENPFLPKYSTDPQLAIRQKSSFSADNLIHTILHLSASPYGADISLEKVFKDTEEVPYRSSLSKARDRISSGFFEDQLKGVTNFLEENRPTYGNLGIYAIDGHQLTLPLTKDLYEKGYSGRKLENDMESHTLKAYVGHCCNVISQTTVSVTFNSTLNEHRDRAVLLDSVPENSLVLYDRLYLSQDLVSDHIRCKKVYFLARCRTNSSKEIADFFKSGKEKQTTQTLGTTLTLVRIKHPLSQDESVMATNLPQSWLKTNHIANLYQMRWESETFQKDFIITAHGKIWHSRSENGILQEFFSKLWLLNATRALMHLCGEKLKDINDRGYLKSNFRLCFHTLISGLKKWMESPTNLMIRLIRAIKRTREKRRKNSRSYKRELKSPGSKYAYNNTVPTVNRPPPKR